MCGIAGLVRLDGAAPERALLERMADRLAHRGPDGSGVQLLGSCGLAHRRLSVIDLQTGGQPMERPDLDRAVAFNGEIYNYLELREQLSALGHRFETRSDTEVLLVGHAQWGEALLPRLRGMFAFALWEPGRRRLLLARDRLGKKPLCFSHASGRQLAFASEAKALLDLPEVGRRIEPGALALYLDLMYVPEQVRLWSAVERLQPGALLLFENGQMQEQRRWAPAEEAEFCGALAPSFDEACARVEQTLAEATRLRLRSDVPVGLFLSGGVDSGLVALLAAEQSGTPLRTFSVGFHDKAPAAAGADQPVDERPFARQVAERIGARHTELMVELDAPALVESVARAFDEPFGDSSAVPTLAMSLRTRAEVPVVLSGDGGDEVFGGYDTYLRHLRAGVGKAAPGPARRFTGLLLARLKEAARRLPAPLAAAIARRLRPLRSRLDQVIDAEQDDLAFRQLGMMRIAHAAQPEELLRPLLGATAPPLAQAWAELLSCVPRDGAALRVAMRTDRLVYLPGDILKKVDIASMACGLEVRSPFLDSEVVALAQQLPLPLLIDRSAAAKERWGKRIPKALLARRMGDAYAYRPKQGFGSPLQQWLDTPRFRALVEDGFASSGSPLRPWFAPGALVGVHRDFRAGKRWLAQEVWNLILLDAWARAHRPLA
jgi:asparagine synthase (glutamine-hydrolysing)